MLSDAGEVQVRLNAGERLCNPRVGRRFRRLLLCVVEMDGDGGLWTVDGASASSMARVTCREEHLKDPERHLNLSAAERRFPAGGFVPSCSPANRDGTSVGGGRSAYIVTRNALYRSCAEDFVHRIRIFESCVVRLP